ncbi:hypothetical protein GCM10009557_30400 [Virgisporangium ochraceum]|nr:hypothetical protein [Virgisporangium ochraceum]
MMATRGTGFEDAPFEDARFGDAPFEDAQVDRSAGAPATDPRLPARGAMTRLTAATVLSLGIIVAANSVATAEAPYRWWANFILVPALVFLTVSVGLPRAARETRFTLAWIGAIVLTVALLLMAGRMGELWPLMIVVPCLGPAGLFALRPTDGSLRAFVDTVAGLAVVGAALGVAFLLIRADVVDPGDLRWWGFFMLAGAVVAGVNGLILLTARRGTYWFSMAVLLIALGGYTTLAAIAELGR